MIVRSEWRMTILTSPEIGAKYSVGPHPLHGAVTYNRDSSFTYAAKPKHAFVEIYAIMLETKDANRVKWKF